MSHDALALAELEVELLSAENMALHKLNQFLRYDCDGLSVSTEQRLAETILAAATRNGVEMESAVARLRRVRADGSQ